MALGAHQEKDQTQVAAATADDPWAPGTQVENEHFLVKWSGMIP